MCIRDRPMSNNLPGYSPSVLGNPSPLVVQSSMSSSGGYMQDPVMSLSQGNGFMQPHMQPMMFANQMGHQGMPSYFGGMMMSPPQMGGMNPQMAAMNNQTMNMNNQQNMVNNQQHTMGSSQQGISGQSVSQGSLSSQGLGQSLGSQNLANQPINSQLSAPGISPGMPQHTMNQAMTQGLNPTGTMFPH
eukprot:TRINITY_DN14798_c0_g1_i1.p1 TRINITY_DN14798_c0_g1~~TRINITY_DN14798_c0_g1_i1.p1  ORF type:complete len:188 (+),score=40.11 TRINITY_DN14798_c0_g1_i1:157-720(+)